MTVIEAMKSMRIFTCSTKYDFIVTDRNDIDHRLVDVSTFTEELRDWLKTYNFTKVEVSTDEEAVCLNCDLDTNALAFLFDGEAMYYYPEYTDNYYADIAENGVMSFEEKKSIIANRRELCWG